MIHDAIAPWTAIRRFTAVLVLGFLATMACENTEESMGPGNGPLPVAAAGADLTVSANVAVVLDGSGSSDPDGGALTYQWSFAARPSGSAAAIDDPAAERPSFIPDLPGEYRVELVVSNGAGDSPPDDVTITAEDNTATAMVGAAGGDAVSKDGNLTLSFPAGAVAANTEIKVTRIHPSQYPPKLQDLDAEAVVYDLQPDGLQLSVPASAELVLPDAALNDDGDLQAPVMVLFTHSGGLEEQLDNQVIAVDAASNEVAVHGELGHFSELSASLAFEADPNAKVVVTAGDIPDELAVDANFTARVVINAVSVAANAHQTDQSAAPVAPLAFDGDFTFEEVGLVSVNDYTCTEPGFGTYGIEVAIGGVTARDIPVFAEISLAKTVECFASGPPKPIKTSTHLLPEGGYGYKGQFGDIEFSVSHEGGATALDNDGDVLRVYSGVPVTLTSFANLRFALSTALGMGVMTSGGLYTDQPPGTAASSSPGAGAATTTVQLVRANLTVPGITDNTGSTTDGIPFDNDPDAQGWLLTQFEDRNILFLAPNGDDVMVDPALAEAFYDNGQSVFGSARPVSAFAGPNGFTATDPMLAVTVADDGSGAGEVLKLELVNGVAVASVVSEVFVQPEPRRIRCIQVGSYICAASSFGVSGGFGGVMFFTWDGQDGFSFIINRLTWAIGIDLIQDGDRVLVASTDFFNNTYAIDELTVDGQYVGFESFPVPEGCVGPGHVMFRSTRDVVISCNTSGLVVGHVFDETP